MSRPAFLRIALPVCVAAGLALWVGRCGHAPEPAPKPVVEEQAEAEVTPEDWAGKFRRQLPPPAELTPDAAVISGSLENGLRYFLMDQPHAADAALRLVVLAGSLHEEEREQGFAHFVEHMAFQGSRQFPDGQIMAVFERLGLAAGAHTNAYTSRDATMYKLDILIPDDHVLDTAFKFLRDVSDGVQFAPQAVDNERRVVLRELEERRWWDDVQRRREAIIFPEVPAAQRSPIGTVETISAATPEMLRSFWRRHYVPSRIAIVAAGNVKALRLEQRVRDAFGSLPPLEEPKAPAGDPLGGAGVVVECLNHTKSPEQVRLTLAAPQPAFEPPDDLQKQRRKVAQRVAADMLRARLDEESERLRLAAAWRHSDRTDLTSRIAWLGISGEVQPYLVKPALALLAREWRRAKDHGFAEPEFHFSRNLVRRALLTECTRRLADGAAGAADSLVDSVCRGSLAESPEDELNRTRTTLATLTKKECEEVFREDWSRGALRFILDGTRVESLVEEAARTVEEEWKRPVRPAPEFSDARALSFSFPDKPRKVIRRAVMPGDWMEAELENRVLVRMKPLPGLGGSVFVQACAGYGALSVPKDQAAVKTAAQRLTWFYPLEGWDREELTHALSHEECDARMDVTSEAICWYGLTNRESLSRQMELLCESMRRPGVLDSSQRRWTPSARDREWEKSERRDAFSRDAGSRLLYPEDDRMLDFPPGFEHTSGESVARWLEPSVKQSRLCLILSGDFDPLAALESIRRTFGTLPPRSPWDAACPFPPPPEHARPLLVEEAPDSSSANIVFVIPLPGSKTHGTFLQHFLAAEIIELRMEAEFRERTGLSYSPRTIIQPEPGGSRDWIFCHVKCPPEAADECAGRLRDLISALRTQPPTADEWQRAARPMAAQLLQNKRQPFTWSSAMLRPEILVHPSLRPEAKTFLALESAVRTLLASFPPPEACSELRLLPEKKE